MTSILGLRFLLSQPNAIFKLAWRPVFKKLGREVWETGTVLKDERLLSAPSPSWFLCESRGSAWNLTPSCHTVKGMSCRLSPCCKCVSCSTTSQMWALNPTKTLWEPSVNINRVAFAPTNLMSRSTHVYGETFVGGSNYARRWEVRVTV